MQSRALTTIRQSIPRYHRSAFAMLWISVLVTGQMLAYQLLQRLEYGELFAARLPFDRPPTPVEYVDARDTARALFLPAMYATFVMQVSLTWCVKRWTSGSLLSGSLLSGSSVSDALGGLAAESPARLSTGVSVLKRHQWLCTALVVATLLDALSTIAFFHTQSVVDELHPFIRAASYAFGRTAGPLLAKAVQLGGVLAVGTALPRFAGWLFATATVIYLVAAVVNLFHI